MIPVTNSGTTASESPPSVIAPVDQPVALQSAANDAADDRERDDDDERERSELQRVDKSVGRAAR